MDQESNIATEEGAPEKEKKSHTWWGICGAVGAVMMFSVILPAYEEYHARAEATIAESSAPVEMKLLPEELAMIDQLRGSTSELGNSRIDITETVSVNFGEDSFGGAHTCWVNIDSPTHHRFDLTYQLGRSTQEAIYGTSSLATGASFRLKGQGSSEIFELSAKFGGEKTGMSASDPRFPGLVVTLAQSPKVMVDYGQGQMGSMMVDEFDTLGFLIGYRIAHHLCG